MKASTCKPCRSASMARWPLSLLAGGACGYLIESVIVAVIVAVLVGFLIGLTWSGMVMPHVRSRCGRCAR